MRILMVHNRYGATTRGGAERVVERLVSAFEERGHEVDVYDRTTAGFNALGRLPVLLRAFWHLVDTFNVVAVARLRARLRRVKPDIIHTHNLVGCGGLTPWVIRRSGIPWVHTLHDVQLITPSGLVVGDQPLTTLERSFLGHWFRALRRSLFGSPTMVTSPSRWLLQLHRSNGFFPRSRDVVIGNPADAITDMRMTRGYADVADRSASDPHIRSPRPHPRIRDAVRRFLFLGQVEGQKGILVLVEAFRQLWALYDDITLHIVGDGALSPTLKRMSRDIRGLILRGRLDADGVHTALAESDVLVVPSLCAENQPSTILEAYAAGIPVIASRVGGIPEILRDGESGFLVDPGSVEDLLRALRACVEDPKRVRAMTAACRAVALEHATERIAIQFEEVYTAVSTHVHPPSRQPMGSFREG